MADGRVVRTEAEEKKNVLRQTERDGHSAITLTLKLFGLSSV